MYLFIFTIGPVQPFIANSRKVRDMYAGSKLLSGLMKKAVLYLEKKEEIKEEIKVIFPLTKESELSNMPNRLIAKFCNEDEEFLQDTAEELTKYIKDEFLKECMEILKEAGIEKKGLSMAEKQLSDFLEIYWLYEKYKENDYANTYKKLFTNINAVKGIRPFSQIDEPWSRKCILFPAYNAIFAKNKNKDKNNPLYPYNINKDYVYDISENKKLSYAVKINEALSAPALVKRMYKKDEQYGEIYSIRRMLLKSRIDKNIDLIDKLSDELSDAVYDLNNKNELSEEEYNPKTIEDAKKLFNYINKNKIELNSYYALIKFDGDNMGEIFIQRKTEEAQKRLSNSINEFAKKAPSILLEYKGIPIFAGGEDFLGFLPLDTLFDCICKLQEEFNNEIKQTFSMGIAVAHVMQPLKEVTAEADILESIAKKADGKNAFAIGILKRSGEKVYAPPYKMTQDNNMPCLKDMQKLIDILKKDSFCSRTLIFNIYNLFMNFAQEDDRLDQQMAEVLIREYAQNAFIDRTQIDLEKLIESIKLFYREEHGVKEFIDTMNVISFLAREVR